jgi:hypothetical protein
MLSQNNLRELVHHQDSDPGVHDASHAACNTMPEHLGFNPRTPAQPQPASPSSPMTSPSQQWGDGELGTIKGVCTSAGTLPCLNQNRGPCRSKRDPLHVPRRIKYHDAHLHILSRSKRLRNSGGPVRSFVHRVGARVVTPSRSTIESSIRASISECEAPAGKRTRF